MDQNVRVVQASDALREAAAQLAERALDAHRLLEGRREPGKKMERIGREAQRVGGPAEVTS
jgi:hypothetical protein